MFYFYSVHKVLKLVMYIFGANFVIQKAGASARDFAFFELKFIWNSDLSDKKNEAENERESDQLFIAK